MATKVLVRQNRNPYHGVESPNVLGSAHSRLREVCNRFKGIRKIVLTGLAAIVISAIGCSEDLNYIVTKSPDKPYSSPNHGTYSEYAEHIVAFLRGGEKTITFPDGRKYVGEVEDGQPNGRGTMTFPDGRKLRGQFKDGRFVGR